MDAGMQKHRMRSWLGRLFVALSLVASWGVWASEDSVPGIYTLCGPDALIGSVPYTGIRNPSSYPGYPYSVPLGTPGCNYTDLMAVGQAVIANLNAVIKGFNYVLDSCSSAPPPFQHSYSCGYHNTTGSSSAPYRRMVFITAFGCPTPTVYPEIPYLAEFGDTGENMCWRTVPDITLSITLSGGGEVEPSNGSTINTLPFIATVIDQNTGQPTTNPVNVHISLKVDPTSGGHDHGDNTRLRGGIAGVKTCTSDAECWSNQTVNGAVVFNFNPTDTSGTHTITATCDGCTNTATANVDVKVEGLWPISGSVYYALTEDGSSKVIGSTTEHSSNHYVIGEAQQQLWRLAQAFYEYQLQNGVASPTLLHLNDASLKWGGLFDKDGDWDTPHKEHRRGSVIDIRANSSPGAIPRGLTDTYIDIATRFGIDPHLEYDSDPVLRHFHTRLLNRKE